MVQLFFIVVFIFLVSYLPGRSILDFFPLLRREKFITSFGLTFFLYYTVGFLSFILQANSLLLHLFTLLILILFSLVTLLKRRWLNYQELVWLAVFFSGFWVVVSMQGIIPLYVGSKWHLDWFEHYERMRFFLDRLPLNTIFFGTSITGRPPLFNVTAYFFQSLIGREFWHYQLVASLLNYSSTLGVFSVVCLLVKNKSHATTKFLLLAISMLLLNPSFIIQVTYTWTKELAAYYTLIGFYFYFRFRKENTNVYIFVSAVSLAAALLSHYSAVPFVLGICVDGLIQIVVGKATRRKYYRYAAALFITAILSWFIWAITNYGMYQTFLGNTSFEWQKESSVAQFASKNVNVFTRTFFPIVSHVEVLWDHLPELLRQQNPLVILYDLSYSYYSSIFPGQITTTLSLVLFISITLFVIKRFRRHFRFRNQSLDFARDGLYSKVGYLASCSETGSRACPGVHTVDQSTFKLKLGKFVRSTTIIWVNFIVVGTFLGILSSPVPVALGYGSVILQPLALMVIAIALYILSVWRTIYVKRLGVLVFLGICVEALLGVGLRLYVSQTEVNPDYLRERNREQEIELHFPENKVNYKMKVDHNLLFLADRYKENLAVFVFWVILGEVLSLSFLGYTLFNPNKKWI